MRPEDHLRLLALVLIDELPEARPIGLYPKLEAAAVRQLCGSCRAWLLGILHLLEPLWRSRLL